MAKKFSELVAKMSPERQARAKVRTQAMLQDIRLQELREARQMTQAALAQTLGIEQPSVSKIESQADMLVSTLREYVEGLGGTLEIVARFPDGDVRIGRFSDL
jgi:transcriptional regulator with XRE-family HTH domain